MPKTIKNLPNKISKIRSLLHLTQNEMGKCLGVDQTFISMLESGKAKPSKLFIIALCSVFHISEEWLYKDNGIIFVSQDNRAYNAEINKLVEQFLYVMSNENEGVKYMLKHGIEMAYHATKAAESKKEKGEL